MCEQQLIKQELVPAYLEAADGNEVAAAVLTEYRDHRPAKPKAEIKPSVTGPKKEPKAKGKYDEAQRAKKGQAPGNVCSGE